ncbi:MULTISPECIES: hypothetical protein [Pseudomonas]|uniref:Uncharacterized protein n=1 Tax=Pseudomonas sp. W17 TaxID=3144407 RepID=A0AAU7X438_9PSED|nr:hypothetical protein [Pseudomonas protegens]
MSTLRTPSLGPIVGHTTDTSCRLWIAASDALDEKGVAEDIRTIASNRASTGCSCRGSPRFTDGHYSG